MADLPALGANDFGAFFEAIHGHLPFPWQTRLAARLASDGGWPEVLDLPTGSGKTAALDVAVFQLAFEAGQASRTAPLRIVYVIDRRTVVDQAHDRAKKISTALEAATSAGAQSPWKVYQRLRANLRLFARHARGPGRVTWLPAFLAQQLAFAAWLLARGRVAAAAAVPRALLDALVGRPPGEVRP